MSNFQVFLLLIMLYGVGVLNDFLPEDSDDLRRSVEQLAVKHEADAEAVIICLLDSAVAALAVINQQLDGQQRTHKAFWFVQATIGMLKGENVANIEFKEISIEVPGPGDVH